MTTPEILDEIPGGSRQQQKTAKPIHGYYRQPNGDITVDVISPMERMHYIEEGWQYLSQYGTFDITTAYMANHPFEVLFMKGGAKEMRKEQIIEHGFHVNAPTIPSCGQVINQYHKLHDASCLPYRPVSFPQGLDYEKFPCDYCTRVSYTQDGKNQHEEVMHKKERGDIMTGTVLANSLLKGLSGSPTSKDPTDVMKVLDSVGLTLAQKKALQEAGLLVKEESNG